MTKEEINQFKTLIQNISKARLDISVSDCVKITRNLETCAKILAAYEDKPKQIEHKTRTIKK